MCISAGNREGEAGQEQKLKVWGNRKYKGVKSLREWKEEYWLKNSGWLISLGKKDQTPFEIVKKEARMCMVWNSEDTGGRTGKHAWGPLSYSKWSSEAIGQKWEELSGTKVSASICYVSYEFYVFFKFRLPSDFFKTPWWLQVEMKEQRRIKNNYEILWG